MRALPIQMSGRFIMSHGTVPILKDGEVVARSVRGASKEDERCAQAVREAI